MDCAGVCINGYFDGTGTSVEGLWGAEILQSYTDSDGDGWGKPGTGAPYCTSDDMPAGRASNNADLNDNANCLSNILKCSSR